MIVGSLLTVMTLRTQDTNTQRDTTANMNGVSSDVDELRRDMCVLGADLRAVWDDVTSFKVCGGLLVCGR